jgi:hypothetical protein
MKLARQFRHDLEEVADEAVVGDLEDRGFFVLVDGDDDLRVLHAGEVLDGARDADGDVEFRGDDLAGLADLVVVRGVARVDRGARGADARAKLVGEREDVLVELSAEARARPPETTRLARRVRDDPTSQSLPRRKPT